MTFRTHLLCCIFAVVALLPSQASQTDNDSVAYQVWQRAFTAEVSEVKQPLEAYNRLLDQLRKTNRFSFTSNPQVYRQCRQLARLAYIDEVRDHIRYSQALKVLSNHFWNECRDTLLAVTLLLESNRLDIDAHLSYDNIGLIHSGKTEELFKFFKNEREAELRVFWLSAYLFGPHGTATRMLCDLAASYYKRHNYLAAQFYLNRAEEWNSALINDANTNFALVSARKLDIRSKLRARNQLYLASVFHCDESFQAQKVRTAMLPLFESSVYGDAVSACYFREMGLDCMGRLDYSYAANYFQRAIADYRSVRLSKSDSLYYANTCYQLGYSLRKLGRSQQAKQAYNEAVTMLKKHSELTETFIFAKIELARTMLELGERLSASRTTVELAELLLYEDGDTPLLLDFLPDIDFSFKNREQCAIVGMVMFETLKGLTLVGEDDERAMLCMRVAQQTLEQYEMQNSSLYYNNKVALARQYLALNNTEKATAELEDCVKAYSSGKGINVADVIEAHNLLGRIAHQRNNKRLMCQSYAAACQTAIDYSLSQLFTMEENERAQFLERVRPALSETMSNCLNHSGEAAELAEVAFNCSLFLKGLLLQSSNIVRNAVHDTGNEELARRYERMLAMKNTSEYQTVDADYDERKEVLELLRDKRVAKLIEPQKKYFFQSCRDIQRRLGSNEVAIEFVETAAMFNDYSIVTPDQQYWAIVLTGSGQPQCVSLFRGKQARQLSPQLDRRMYELVWQPLTAYLRGCNSIYFSPTGVLHNFPIEYLYSPSGRLHSEEYNIRRLSTLRELTMSRRQQRRDGVALFGGLDYYVDKDIWHQWGVEKDYPADFATYHDITPPKADRRGALGSLEGSEREVDYISALLQRAKVNSVLYKHEQGTERRFRSLSGADFPVLHLSTHGFVDSVSDEVVTEYNTLSRSALWLSGAGDASMWPEVVPSGVDDGILRASEIISLDFRNVSLVVLSACNTGVGHIDADGVFGMQRGFKKAGAQSLLMTLWEVDDAASETLMCALYRNMYEKHMPISDALTEAQKEVRSHRERGWDRPEYWAAFVLMDVIDN